MEFLSVGLSFFEEDPSGASLAEVVIILGFFLAVGVVAGIIFAVGKYFYLKSEQQDKIARMEQRELELQIEMEDMYLRKANGIHFLAKRMMKKDGLL